MVWLAGADGVSHGVVDIEDRVLGAIVAVLLLVLALDDRECVHNVGHGVAWGWEADLEPRQGFRCLPFRASPVTVGLGRQVEMEEGGVQLAAEQKAALLVPKEWRAASLTLRKVFTTNSCGRRVWSMISTDRWSLFSQIERYGTPLTFMVITIKVWGYNLKAENLRYPL